MESAAASGNNIAVSPISLAEVLYLIEKGRLEPSIYGLLKSALASSAYVIEEASFNVHVVDAMATIPREVVPDLPDRIVSATAVYLGVPVISSDRRIHASGVRTVWWG